MTVPIVNTKTEEILSLRQQYSKVSGYSTDDFNTPNKVPHIIHYDITRGKDVIRSTMNIAKWNGNEIVVEAFDQNINGRV